MAELEGIVIFMILVLVGIGLVSVHYRKKYEELKVILKENFGYEHEE